MGPLEPVICRQGFYCPPPGREQILCPAGSFCPQGSSEAHKCTPGAICPQGTYINRSLLPLVFLVIVDVLLISLVFAAKKFRGKRKPFRDQRHSRSDGLRFLKKTLTFAQSPQFHSLPDDDVELEPRSAGVRRAPTGFLATAGNENVFEGDEDEDQFSRDENPDPDIQQFVKSLSRCTLASNFGLSFEFDNLSFQPRKSSKPVLSEVSGQISSGTLWGIMGASGAGKST
jgi:hypothetical protein